MPSAVLVGREAPDFSLPGDSGKEVTLRDLRERSVVLFFYPLSWTEAAEAELRSLAEVSGDLEDLECEVLVISVDSSPCQRAYKTHLGVDLQLLSDFQREVSGLYGVLNEETGYSQAATFVVDREGLVRYQLVNDGCLIRDSEELLHIVRELERNRRRGRREIKT